MDTPPVMMQYMLRRWDDAFITMHAMILVLLETWRNDAEETFISPPRKCIYLSGGCNHEGVGLCVAKSFHDQIKCVQFHASSCRVRAVCFAFQNLRVCTVAAHMSTEAANF